MPRKRAAHRQHPVTRVAFARMAGVSPASVTRSLDNPRGVLHPARVGKRIDANHPASLGYVRKRLMKTTDVVTKPPGTGAERRREEPVPSEDSAFLQGAAKHFGHLTLTQFVGLFGGIPQFQNYVEVLKTLERVQGARMANEERLGRLIDRELVRTHVLGTLKAMDRKLLGDHSKKAVRRLYSLATAGRSYEEGEGVLAQVKKGAQRGLRSRKRGPRL